MRIFLIILFISTLISKFTFQLGYEFYYHWNKTEITQKYCENKAKPALQCHGKCEMKKMQGENNSNSKIGQNTNITGNLCQTLL